MRHIQLTEEEFSSLHTLLSAARLEWGDNPRWWTLELQKAYETFCKTPESEDMRPRVLEFADRLEAEASGESMSQAIVYEGIAARLRKEFG